MKTANRSKTEEISRRQFLKKSSATAASLTALSAGIQTKAYAAGTGSMKIGLIGCGGRGTGAAVQALNACKRAKLVAMADGKSRFDLIEASPGIRLNTMTCSRLWTQARHTTKAITELRAR